MFQFDLAKKTLEYWDRKIPEPYSEQDIESLKNFFPYDIPQQFLDFACIYGSVRFDSIDTPCAFSYKAGAGKKQDAISHILGYEKLYFYYKGSVQDQGCEEFPKFPAYYLPVGLDFGQSMILLECGQESERVFYWPFVYDRWGSGENNDVYPIANDLKSFLENLEWFED